ncbi:MAG TPA: thrombospondin type 3 repeat-containing protein, partial [candidate division Zixibacteria bacterium]|nr:thrombospondin type 3 repeat-containing protein [candidate division Zixibacteria bacterium]
IGSVYRIHWRMNVYHGFANFDIQYSPNGAAGFWLNVVSDLPITDTTLGSEFYFEWSVPNMPTTTGRIRVQQDNFFDSTYSDSSSRDFVISVLDTDVDGVPNYQDNCPLTPNEAQADSDGDGVGDVCDLCAGFHDAIDADSDLIPDGCDNCPLDANPGQADINGNGVGDACDTCCDVAGDGNDDGALNIADVTYLIGRIFSGGPAPPCCAAADANADGSVNIADVTYTITHIFSGGPAPSCGPDGGSC